MGSGTDEHNKKSATIARWIAQQGYHLLTGGGSGVMKAASKAFCEVSERKGLSIGIIPGSIEDNSWIRFHDYPNEYIELPVFTHLPLSGKKGINYKSRNHINILTSTVIVVLPGSYGTASEVKLALKYNKPVIGFFENINEVNGLDKNIPCNNDFEEITKFVKKFLD